jgi:acyl-CoA thioester hydrolase
MTRHRYDCRVRFSDVDIYGHVNNVKYFEYYQEARLSLLGSRGRSEDEGGLALVVARLDVDYKRPIVFRSDPYLVETWVTRVGDSSFGLSAEIKDGDQVLSRANAVMVAFDQQTQRSRPLTDRERAQLAGLTEG